MLLKIAKKINFRIYSLVSITLWKQRIENWKFLYYKKTRLKKIDLNYFNGKRVAIIGPAESALDEKLGNYIDSFEIVIRINKSVEVINVNKEFIGSKVDILFNCLDETPKGGCGKIDIKLWKNAGVKFLFYPLYFSNDRMQVLKFFFSRSDGGMKIYEFKYNFYKKLRESIKNYYPTTGYSSLFMILKTNPKEIYISGFTFFQTEHKSSYRDEFINADKVKDFIKTNGHHNPNIEFESFKELILKSKLNIKLDKTLNKLIYGS